MASNLMEQAPPDDGESKVMVCLPVESLEEDGQPPQEGDDVEASIEGTVTKVEDGIAWITPKTVNGVPVEAGEGSTQEEGSENQEPDEESLGKQFSDLG